MATNRILMASSTDLHTLLNGPLDEIIGQPRLIGVQDGARLINAVTRLLLADQAPLLIVVDLKIARVGGQAAAIAIRGLETGMGKRKVPILLYGPEPSTPEMKLFCRDVGAAVYLRSRNEKGRENQSKMLVKAMERVLESKMGAKR